MQQEETERPPNVLKTGFAQSTVTTDGVSGGESGESLGPTSSGVIP